MRGPSLIGLSLAALLLLRCAGCGPGGDKSGDAGQQDHPDGGGGTTDGGDGVGTPDGGDPTLCDGGLTALSVEPADLSHQLEDPPQAIQFRANGTFPGGTRDVSSQVQWIAERDDDSPPGMFDAAGLYTPEPGVGGPVRVRAVAPCAEGAARLSLTLQSTFESGDGGTDADYAGPVVTSGPQVPVWVYPSDHTRFPRNLYKVLFQWRTKGNDQFRLTFQGPYGKTVIHTDGVHPQCANAIPPAGCWEAAPDTWKAIAGSNAGKSAEVTLEAIGGGDANVYQAPPIQLGFSRRDVRGAIFYWSTSVAGIRRATVSDLQPEAYVVGQPVATQLAAPGGEVNCVACHTVSRSGRKMIAFTDSSASKGMYVYDVTLNPPPLVRLTTEISTAKGFGTFSPDDRWVVSTVGTALQEFDATTGALRATVVARGTNPDWSPSGLQLAFSDQAGDMPANADLEVVAYDGGWGTPSVLVPAGGKTNLFPSYTHDGQYLAYARGAGKHGDLSLQLWLANAGNAHPPVELVNANRVVNNATTDGQFENNMPTWAPEGDLEWVAFNSLRPYGVVFPSGGTQQIWVAAVDRTKLDAGQDPSFPAFRFAFQDLNENNHRAYWTEDVRAPAADGGVCTVSGASCNPEENTCCLGTECLPTSEITYSCQVAGPGTDGGACLDEGAACSQTNGAPCCGTAVCDDVGSGSTACIVPATCAGLGETCNASTGCCPEWQCLGTTGQFCDDSTICSCEQLLN